MPDELDVVLLRGRAAYVSTCRPLANGTERGRRTDKHDLQKGLFPPGFSSLAWQRSEPVSLILPLGQSLASSPDGGEQGGEQGD